VKKRARGLTAYRVRLSRWDVGFCSVKSLIFFNLVIRIFFHFLRRPRPNLVSLILVGCDRITSNSERPLLWLVVRGRHVSSLLVPTSYSKTFHSLHPYRCPDPASLGAIQWVWVFYRSVLRLDVYLFQSMTGEITEKAFIFTFAAVLCSIGSLQHGRHAPFARPFPLFAFRLYEM
jgi:hypothetical protein